jgi:hypothetical protein
VAHDLDRATAFAAAALHDSGLLPTISRMMMTPILRLPLLVSLMSRAV